MITPSIIWLTFEPLAKFFAGLDVERQSSFCNMLSYTLLATRYLDMGAIATRFFIYERNRYLL